MSKAFTREDDLPDPMAARRVSSALPPGAKNYLTPDGAQRLRAELEGLIQERSNVAVSSNPNVAREQLQILDQRIDHLRQSLESAVIIEPPTGPAEQVRFGATVTVRDSSGEECRYRIVGVDETDMDRGWVSWLSPIAKALLHARHGDRVSLKLPSKEEALEIVSIVYEQVEKDERA